MEIIIYAIKKNDQYHYIGKITKEINKKTITNSDILYQYNNIKLRDIMVDKNATIEILATLSPADKWFTNKLSKVVEKYRNNHPLINVQWMKEGKTSYWEGTDGFWKNKKRDENTILKLSESKYKKIIQYNENGNLLQVWDSGKEAAIKIFDDYKTNNGKGTSRLYSIIKRKLFNKRFERESYWFTYNEMISIYNTIPKQIIIASFRNSWELIHPKKIRKESVVVRVRVSHKIIEYGTKNTIINTYTNAIEAAKLLDVSHSFIRRLCRTNKKMKNGNWFGYGEKNKNILI